MIVDLWELWDSGVLKSSLEDAAKCEVTIWFPKANAEARKPNRIRFDFDKVLSQNEQKSVQTVLNALHIGWL